MHTPIVPTLVLALSVCLPAAAGFTNIVGAQNASQWFAAAGGYEALSFTGFAAKTQITDQYASQGILLGFPSSAGNITQSDAYMYAQDGWGIVGVGSIIASFTQPMYAFAMYYPGSARFTFYSGATTLHHADFLTSGANNFAGFTSDVSFDRVVIAAYTPENFGIFADNMYFSTVPAPASAALLALSAIATGRRRRS